MAEAAQRDRDLKIVGVETGKLVTAVARGDQPRLSGHGRPIAPGNRLDLPWAPAPVRIGEMPDRSLDQRFQPRRGADNLLLELFLTKTREKGMRPGVRADRQAGRCHGADLIDICERQARHRPPLARPGIIGADTAGNDVDRRGDRQTLEDRDRIPRRR